MVTPKTNHHLVELAFGVDRAHESGAGEFFAQKAGLKFIKLADRFALQCLENASTMLGSTVIDFFRLKLLLDEGLDGVLFALGQAEHRCAQPRCGAEGEPVDNVRGDVDRPCAWRSKIGRRLFR